jgi:hypothetical protein
MSENPWWHPTDDDDWDEPLPAVVTLEPDYSAKLPLSGGGLAWQRTKFSPGLLDRLATWQEEFESNFHWEKGWSSKDARSRWGREARDLAADVRAEMGTRAELVVNLWPLQDTSEE